MPLVTSCTSSAERLHNYKKTETAERKRKVRDMLKTDIKALVILGSDILEEGKFDEAERRKYLNASEAASCIRKQWYSKNGAKGEPHMWGYARRGSHGEKFLVESLIAANVPLTMAGRDQETWKDDKRKISATPDGIIQYDDEWIVPEFKTIDPRTNRKNLPRPKDIVQLEIGMELIDANIDRPEGVKLRGLLIYMDSSNYFDILQIDVPRNRNILDRMAKRASKLLRTKDVSNLDREGKRDGGKECKTMCSFREVCGVTMEASADRKRANRTSNFDGSAIRYMELKDAETAIKAEKASLQEDIKNGLHQRSTNKIIVGDITVSLSVQKGRASLNRKAVAAAGIDLSPFEKIGAPSERLLVERA
jgi:hypothetical protein